MLDFEKMTWKFFFDTNEMFCYRCWENETMVKYFARNVEGRKDAKKAHCEPFKPKENGLHIIFGEGFVMKQ